MWAGDVRLDDGSFVLLNDAGDVWTRIRAGDTGVGRTLRNTAVLAHYSREGALLGTLGRFPGWEEAVLDMNGRPATTYPPWGRSIAFALAGNRIEIGTQETGEIRTYEPDGTLTALLCWPAGDLRITDADLDRLISIQSDRAGADVEASARIAERIRALPLPDARPAYGRVIVDDVGLLWISEAFVPMAPPTHWTAVEPGGGVRGQLDVPAGFVAWEIGRNHALGRWTDNDGVDHARSYALNRSG